MGSNNHGYEPLFETKKAKGITIYRLFSISMFVGIILVLIYRATHVPRPGENGRLSWIGMLAAELWFCFYWILTQSLRWRPVYRKTFNDRLSKRYEKELPKVDIFVCTADPVIEPPIMVVNTVLSVMAYEYPPEKLSVYLSDDGGSAHTFYALLEASRFAKHWIPYCKKFNLEPRSPSAYFTSTVEANMTGELSALKKLYEDMDRKIESAQKLGRVPEDALLEYEGFSKWNTFLSRCDHDTILQIVIDGRDPEAKDTAGCKLPTLVYLAREKRPQYSHNYKAGAMNALIRVSSEISNAPVILNLDCDMYSNNSQAIRDALCFFMDEEEGHEIAFVQFPQNFGNLTKNELYGSSLRVIREVEFPGLDGWEGPLYVGTGCFHRREILCGRKFSKEVRIELNSEYNKTAVEDVYELEERLKVLASCTFEKNTQWGNEIGLKYGCVVEDVITGLSIQCHGWKSVYHNPERSAFIGLSATTLDQALVQHKRWSEGDLQILLSKYSPAWYGLGRISTAQLMGYCTYCLWSPSCLATLYYCIIPSVHLPKGIPLFPQVSSLWFVPFAYVIVGELVCSFAEYLWSGGTILGWWNEQRMWLYKRTSSYIFAFTDTVLGLMGYSNSGFIISSKVSDEDVSLRYEKEMMEFGTTSPIFTLLSSLAMLNLFCLVIGLMKHIILYGGIIHVCETMALQILLCGVLVLINLPLYHAAFFRKDNGKLPSATTFRAVVFAVSACTLFTFVN